jgi:hypothetical protein
MSFLLPFEQPLRMSQKGMISYRIGFRSARTDAPATASTSGGGYLAGLTRLAKGKIQTNLTCLNAAQRPAAVGRVPPGEWPI